MQPRVRSYNTLKAAFGSDNASGEAANAFCPAVAKENVPDTGCGEADRSKLIHTTLGLVNIPLMNAATMFAAHLTFDVSEGLDPSATAPFELARFTPDPTERGQYLSTVPTNPSWQPAASRRNPNKARHRHSGYYNVSHRFVIDPRS